MDIPSVRICIICRHNVDNRVSFGCFYCSLTFYCYTRGSSSRLFVLCRSLRLVQWSQLSCILYIVYIQWSPCFLLNCATQFVFCAYHTLYILTTQRACVPSALVLVCFSFIPFARCIPDHFKPSGMPSSRHIEHHHRISPVSCTRNIHMEIHQQTCKKRKEKKKQ